MRTTANTLVSQRFQILSSAGIGGMGAVYRAQDQHTGQIVALKLLHSEIGGASDRYRFLREAQLLAQLHHPHIVSYVAHGYTDEGVPFLAMEWLEGEDLGQRLRRKGLSLSESLALLRGVAEALATAHRRGIVHRDLKPSNLFLRGGQIDRVTVLDFGVARQTLGSSLGGGNTQTGMIIGTPQYMAPEQARGQRDLTPSVDVFSLGCVLFECLTGRPPFSADHIVALLAKILFEEPPPLRSLRPELPPSVEALVARLLEKDPARRPRDAGELLGVIDALSLAEHLDAPVRSEAGLPPTLSTAEQWLVSVILVSRRADIERGETLVPEEAERIEDTLKGLRDALSLYGADVEYLASDSLVATLMPDDRRVATDQAAQAARIALALHERWPGAAVALATGRGVLRERLPIGEAIDRAVRLLPRVRGAGEPDGVLVDDMTAGLLDSRFDAVHLHGGVYALRGERQSADELRLLLGKPTPCVGREQELDMLERLLAGCIEESVSHAVLVTAPPGLGKSRLRHEFLRRARVRTPDFAILFARGETTTARSAYGLLRQALSRLCGITGSEPLDEQREKLIERVGRSAGRDGRRIAGFLGELCGLALPAADNPHLEKARQAPWLMGEQLGQALVDFLRAECSGRPIVLVLEDLHYADALSIKLIERALLSLEDLPFFMVALARPEVKEQFPGLWAGRVQEIPLRGLSRKASERLVLETLGRDTPPAVVSRMVQQAAGNALFLEELIRAQVEGKGDELPETILAILQSRIARLHAELRRVLRAGSLLGETFWRGAVLALLGWERQQSDLDACLHELVRAEILELHRDSRYPDEEEYGFRHALMSEAAYSLLTDEDRRAGHLVVARFLEEKGERDPYLRAEHYRRGGERERAVPLYLEAGELSHRISALSDARRHYAAAHELLAGMPESAENRRLQLDALLRQVQLGILADSPEVNLQRLDEARQLLGGLAAEGGDASERTEHARSAAWIDLLSGRTHYVRGQLGLAIEEYQKVLPVAEALGDEQLLAIPSQLIGAALLTQGHAAKSQVLLARAVALQDRLDSDYERLRAAGYYATSLVMSGRYREGMALHEELMARAAESKQPAGLSVSHLFHAVSLRVCGDFTSLLRCAERTLIECHKSGDLLYEFVALSLIGWAHSFLGQHEAAVDFRSRARGLERELGGRIGLTDWFAVADAEIALRAGHPEQAVLLAEQMAAPCRKEERLLALGLAEQVWGLALGRIALRDPDDPSARLRSDEADAHLGAGLRIMEQSEQRLGAAILRLEWARLLERRRSPGDAERAQSQRAQAVAQFEAAGCPHLVAEVERAL